MHLSPFRTPFLSWLVWNLVGEFEAAWRLCVLGSWLRGTLSTTHSAHECVSAYTADVSLQTPRVHMPLF